MKKRKKKEKNGLKCVPHVQRNHVWSFNQIVTVLVL